MGYYPRDMTTQKWGTLTAVERLGLSPGRKDYLWRCKCDCGREVLVSVGSLPGRKTCSWSCPLRKPGKSNLPKYPKRDSRIFDLYQKGKTLAWLAKEFDLTSQRISQIVDRESATKGPKRAWLPRNVPRPYLWKQVSPDILEALAAGKITTAEAMDQAGCCKAIISHRFKEYFGRPWHEVSKERTAARDKGWYDRWMAGERWQDIADSAGVSKQVFWQGIHRTRQRMNAKQNGKDDVL